MSLYSHQKEVLARNPKYHGLWFECGTGKTLTAIKLAENNANHVLVVCPKSLRENWAREIEKWRFKTADEKAITRWTVVTKEQFRKHWKDLALEGHDGLILDEAHFFAGHTSKMHKNACKYLKKTQPNCAYLLTATPYMSTPYNIMCYERLLGRNPNFMQYRTSYFNEVRMGGRYVPVVKKGIEKQLASIVQSLGTVVKKEDCLDLPDQVYKREDFKLTAEQKRGVKELEMNPLISAQIVYWTKKHQICGGSMKDEDEIYEYKSEKLERIKEYAKEYKKFIVVSRYNAELHRIKRELGERAHILNGATKDRDELINKMDASEDGIFLINSSMSEGYNLIGYNMMVFYSNGFSFKDRIQIEGRIHRIGQINKCTYIDFVVQGDIDEDVLKSLKNKEDFDIAIYKRKK